MKKYFSLLVLSVIVLATGCTETAFDGDAPDRIAAASQSIGGTRSEAILYHEATSTWMRPIVDPYRLEHMQRAYDNLAAAEASRTLSGVQRKRFAASRLAPTHHHVRIYPKTEEEQWKLEQTKDITVGYIPFDYAGIPSTEQPARQSIAAQNVYPDERRYTVIHEGYMTAHGPAPTETILLPALYAIWPCTKPFPQDMEYEILYDVFLPDAAVETAARSRMSTAATLDAERLEQLEQEAIALAVGGQTVVFPKTYITGKITHYDKFLHREVPLANLQIRFQHGSYTMNTYTRDNGSFTLPTGTNPLNFVFSCVFINDKWKITEEDSTEPITVFNRIESVGSYRFCLDFPTSPFVEIHRAINFFYNASHTVPKWYYEAGLRLIACQYPNETAGAEFYSSRNNAAYIKVYNRGLNNHPYMLSLILHEMGHFIQFSMQGYNNNILTEPLLKEGYAQYVGWYLGELYYKTIGYVKPDNSKDITQKAVQDWKKTDKYKGYPANYSPLFVDLVDDYNQSLKDTLYNIDNIKNVPASVIHRLATDCKSWDDYKRLLKEYVGVYYSEKDLQDYLEPYEYFLSH